MAYRGACSQRSDMAAAGINCRQPLQRTLQYAAALTPMQHYALTGCMPGLSNTEWMCMLCMMELLAEMPNHNSNMYDGTASIELCSNIQQHTCLVR